MKRKVLLWLLAAAMCLPTFAACSDNTEISNETAVQSDAASDTPTPEPEKEETEIGLNTAKLLYADRDYGGYNFRIADRDFINWGTFDVYAEELTGEVINDSVYNRNIALEDTLKIN